MLKSLFLFGFIWLNLALYAQSNVVLRINHKVGMADFEMGITSTNSEGHYFSVNYLEYYITRITVIPKTGEEIVIPDEVCALVNPSEGTYTDLYLGNYDVDSVMGVRFHIGVYEPANSGDPSVYEEGHPLANQSPSMHWAGAGYRFVSTSGEKQDDLSSSYYIFGASLGDLGGDDNYFETGSNSVSMVESDTLIASIEGDYGKMFDGISIEGPGPIDDHSGEKGIQLLQNFRDLVFGEFTASLSEEVSSELAVSIYPNPSAANGEISVQLVNQEKSVELEVINALGEVVQRNTITPNEIFNIQFQDSGIYFFHFLDEDAKVMTTRQVIVE